MADGHLYLGQGGCFGITGIAEAESAGSEFGAVPSNVNRRVEPVNSSQSRFDSPLPWA